MQEFQIRDTVIKPRIVDSEHKFDCTFLDHVSIKIVTNIVWRCHLARGYSTILLIPILRCRKTTLFLYQLSVVIVGIAFLIKRDMKKKIEVYI